MKIASNFILFLGGSEPTSELVNRFTNNNKTKKSIIKYFLLANNISLKEKTIEKDFTESIYPQITEFLKYKEFTSCKQSTIKDYKTKLEKYYEKYKELKEGYVIDFLKEEKLTVKATYLSLFKQYFSYHKKHLNIPIRKKDIKIARRASTKVKVLYEYELRKVEALIVKLDISDPDQYLLKTILILYMYTGCRVSELYNKMFSEIDFKSKEIWVVGKGNKPRPVSLETSPKLLKFLKEHRKKYAKELEKKDLPIILNRNLQPVSISCIQKKVKKVFNELGFDNNKSIHSLRHSFGTNLANNGLDKFTISEVLGHSNIETTENYIRLSKQMQQKVKGKFKV